MNLFDPYIDHMNRINDHKRQVLSSHIFRDLQCDQVLSEFVNAGIKGITDPEIAVKLNLPASTISARRNDLLKRGFQFQTVGIENKRRIRRLI